MCFIQTKESKLLIAKRDIRVYKIGKYANNVKFISLYRSFIYRTGSLEKVDIDFEKFSISQGYHSFINLNIKYFNWGASICTTMHNVYTIVSHKNILTIGEFIIPKDSKYMLNHAGEVVANNLIYTGRYLKFKPTSNLKIKEVWKDEQVKYLLIKIKLTKQ